MTDSFNNDRARVAPHNTDVPGAEEDLHDEGRQSVFAKLYRQYFSDLVIGLRATYGAGPPDPEDVAQQAFAKLKARGSYDEISDLEGFVWIAARNIVMSEKRAMRVRSDHAIQTISEALWSEGCDDFDPERVLMAKEELDLVMQALKDMPERRRTIFLANRIDGLTPEAAGKKCGVSRSSAVRHIGLATAAIAEALAEARSSSSYSEPSR